MIRYIYYTQDMKIHIHTHRYIHTYIHTHTNIHIYVWNHAVTLTSARIYTTQEVPSEQAQLKGRKDELKTYLESSAQIYRNFQSLQDEKQREQEFYSAFDRYVKYSTATNACLCVYIAVCKYA
jgi:hypothetical protein